MSFFVARFPPISLVSSPFTTSDDGLSAHLQLVPNSHLQRPTRHGGEGRCSTTRTTHFVFKLISFPENPSLLADHGPFVILIQSAFSLHASGGGGK